MGCAAGAVGMSLQPMPVRSALRQPGRLISMGGGTPTFFSHEGNQDVFDICKHVWFGSAPTHSEILQFKSGKPVREAVGPQRLPFDHLWFEGIWDLSNGGGIEGACAYAVYAHSNDALDVDTLEHLDTEATSYSIWSLMNDGSVRRSRAAIVARIDGQGCIESINAALLDPGKGFVTTIDKSTDEHAWALAMVAPAMWAIGLMNCRNVTLKECSTAAKPSRKRRRKRPELKYHTIILPGQGRTPNSEGVGGGELLAQHRVRGHFKTFTADAPLMGRHVGTYWWGWQVRGKRENGVVVSDYKIGALT